MLPASVIVATFNRSKKLKRCLNALLKLNYPKYEIIVVNDASTDDTKDVLKKYGNRIRVINHKKNKGTAATKKTGILSSKYPLVAIMDDDCIPDKDWLFNLVKRVDIKNKIAGAAAWGITDGATCYYKDVMIKAGLFDKNFSGAYREDTDLNFRIFDLGYKIVRAPDAKFIHDPPKPRTLKDKLKYIKKRVMVHEFDALLFKKHPKRSVRFFKMKYRIVSPLEDFKRATGLWHTRDILRGGGGVPWKKEKGDVLALSSPQGIVLISGNKLKIPIIFLGGILYAIALKFVRFYGSIKYKTFLL